MKLKFGMVGGGNKAFIGDVHRHGALWDDLAELVAGCFSRDPNKNIETSKIWGVPDQSRVYENYEEMALEESKRDDGIDFVSIVTPNNSHYEIAKCFLENGIHVMCDKPLTLTIDEAEELLRLSKEKDLLFGVTYTFTGYPMVAQAYEMIKNGEIGDITYVSGEYYQEWLALSLENEDSEQATWRMDPASSGKCGSIADIGTHVEALISKMTGLKIDSVLARFSNIPSHLPLENNSQVLLRYQENIPGLICTSQVSIGHEVDICIRICGTKGTIEWNYTNPSQLKVAKINEPIQYYSAAKNYLYDSSKVKCRLPSGSIEGFYEAFANIYFDFCKSLLMKKEGISNYPTRFPTVEDGLMGVKFIDACYSSNQKGNVWISL